MPAGSWRPTIVWCLAVWMAVMVSPARADSVVWQEFSQRIKAWQTITPLGEAPFGERLSLYTGELSFYQADITLKGRGPDLVIGRTFSPKIRNNWPSATYGFVDWQLEIPRLRTRSPPANTGHFWHVGPEGGESAARCSQFSAPPLTVSPVPAEQWWNGHQLVTADGASQELLRRDAANPLAPEAGAASYPVVTARHWQIRCLAQTANGVEGEAFLAIDPEGTRYWFNWLVAGPRTQAYLWQLPWSGNPGSGPRPIRGDITDATALVTRIEGRYGNALSYHYDGPRLIGISASDGRDVRIDWLDDHRIGAIHAGRGAKRTWRFDYASFVGRDATSIEYLARVTLPNTAQWQLNLQGLDDMELALEGDFPSCDLQNAAQPTGDVTARGSIGHPSGLVGDFSVQMLRHGRSRVPYVCHEIPGSGAIPAVSADYFGAALISRHQHGAGIDRRWNYDYHFNASWDKDCPQGCDQTVWTAETRPDGSIKRWFYHNGWDAMEGKLLRVDENPEGPGARRSTLYSYAAADAGPWPSKLGVTPFASYLLNNDLAQAVLTPLQEQVIQLDGSQYTRHVESHDIFGEPVITARFNDIPGQVPRREQTQYHHDLEHWVLAQVASRSDLNLGEVEARTDYDTLARPVADYSFGILQHSYAWDTQGQLAAVTDGLGHSTRFENYKGEIPRRIIHADGSTETADVDDFDRITRVTDPNGAVTTYAWGSMGLLTDIRYPQDDDIAWLPIHYSYDYVDNHDRGIVGPHWRRVLSQGALREVTSYDASLQPILEDRYIEGDDGSARVIRHAYDWQGLTSFDSDALPGHPLLDQINQGLHYDYDALGREIQRTRDSELGPIPNRTRYLAGAGIERTDPAGHSLTTYYQVFDTPQSQDPIRITAPEGITQQIERNPYGDVLSLRQYGDSGGWPVDQTRHFTYDSGHRLCRYTDAESGSTVLDYDAAGNIAWQADGLDLAIDNTDCGREQVAGGNRTDYSYDAMNRPIWEHPPAGTDAISYAYDPAGHLTDSEAGLSRRHFSYDRRGLLTRESQIIGVAPAAEIAYSHDAQAHLAGIRYPDGLQLDLAPDAMGRPSLIRASGTVLARDIRYFADDSPQAYTLGNGISRTAAQNLRQLPARLSYAGSQGLWLDESYSYDVNGNLDQRADNVNPSRNASFGYDALNRLVRAEAAQGWGLESYAYDALNNLRNRQRQDRHYPFNYDAHNRLIGLAGDAAQVDYDARGNRIRQGDQHLAYNARNQLLAVADLASYAYDSAGHRIRKSLASGPSTDFIYSQAGQLLATRDTGSDQWTDYIHLGSALLARWTAGTATWLLTDRLGSPIAEAGPQGLLSQRNDYRPWGEPLTPDSQTQPGFTGHVRDPETGLNYALARYYRPAIGQFDSVDPRHPEAGDLFGFNRYAYAANNPILNTDPDGQQTLPATVYQIDWSKPGNRQTAVEVAGIYTSFMPVIGDIQNIADAYREPTALNIAVAGVGLIPEVGGARHLKY